MGIFTISDLHLSFGADKPMDVFGGRWENYTEKLKTEWNSMVAEEDVVVLPGDLSWAMYLSDAVADFTFIHRLKGQKILMKGNHDYWFTTAAKIRAFCEENGLDTLRLLHNNFYSYRDEKGKLFGICGTKGADILKRPSGEEEKKLLNRETIRLANSIRQAQEAGCEEILVFLHYPPIMPNGKFNDNPFVELLHENGIQKCFYGHLHNLGAQRAVEGEVDGVDYRLVSCDHLNFKPLKIL